MRGAPPSAEYDVLPSHAEDTWGSPEPLLNSETLEWDAIANLDDFFRRIYKYYEEKGLPVILVSRVLDLAALGFTIAFSGMLLLCINWPAFKSECVENNTCDLSEVVFIPRPLHHGPLAWRAACLAYLAIFSTYWLYCLAHLLMDLKESADIQHFTRNRLGLSEHQLQTVSWPDVAKRIVQAQKTTRLCVARDLTEVDVVARIMRKENYLVGMLNRGVLALTVPLPGLSKHFMLTKTLEWNLHWCLLDAMFDRNFRVKPDFVNNEANLQRRFRRMAVANLLFAPFLLAFLLIFFFLRNAERLYQQPGAAGTRRWSPLAAWRLREFNELPHYLHHRLNASHKAAEKYLAQFPSPTLGHCAKFVAYVVGSFAAAFLSLALYDDRLLERPLYGRNLVWCVLILLGWSALLVALGWGATLGIVLTISRGFIVENGIAFEPEAALLEVTAHTHWLPRHWRGRAHTREVQTQFQQLFQFKAVLFAEEVASVLLTPFVLWFSLPACAPAVLAFIRDFTTHVEGVGDVCSLATFDFQRHGNSKYGSPTQAPKSVRSRQGKMEKSFLSFATNYPTWEPHPAAKQFLAGLTGAPLPPAGDLLPRGAGLRGVGDGHHARMAAFGPSAFAYPGFPYPGFYPSMAGVSPYSVAAGGKRGAGASPEDSSDPHLFASADFAASAMRASFARPVAGAVVGETEARVASGQLALQSFYEEREQVLRRGGLHHSAAVGTSTVPPGGYKPPQPSLGLSRLNLPPRQQEQAQGQRRGDSEGLLEEGLGGRGRSQAAAWQHTAGREALGSGRGTHPSPSWHQGVAQSAADSVPLADLRQRGDLERERGERERQQPSSAGQRSGPPRWGTTSEEEGLPSPLLGGLHTSWLANAGSEALGDPLGEPLGDSRAASGDLWRGTGEAGRPLPSLAPLSRSWGRAKGANALTQLPLGGLDAHRLGRTSLDSPPASEMAFVVYSPKA